MCFFVLAKFYICKYYYHIVRCVGIFFLTTYVFCSVFILQYIAHTLVLLAIPLHKSSWEKVFLLLDKSDIIGLTSMVETDQSEGRKKLTWIWNIQGMDITDDKKVHNGQYV